MENKQINVADKFNDGSNAVVKYAKSRIFDIAAVAIIVAMCAISLGAITHKDVTWESFTEIVFEFGPIYISAILLSNNFYEKGKYAGKGMPIYVNTLSEYSKVINDLTGHMLDVLPDFCAEYNDKERERMQREILRLGAISWERYDVGTADIPPLKIWTRKALIKQYGKPFANIVARANNLHVHGIYANTLTSSTKVSDGTIVGSTEQELSTKRRISYVAGYIVTLLFITFVTVKNFAEWGWASVLMMMFKMLYVFAKSYMKYFEGYKDITMTVVGTMNNKLDKFKQFHYWYAEKYSTENCSNNL